MDTGKVIKYVNHEGKEKQVVIMEKVGEGKYGIVYKALLEGFGVVAVKQQTPLSQKLLDSIKTEIRVSKVLSDEHAFNLKKVLLNGNDLKKSSSQYISNSDDVPLHSVLSVYNFADGISLQNVIDINESAKITLSDDAAENYIIDLLSCLEELKKNGIAHRDIKPDNIMIHSGKAKFIDFGFACFFKECTGKKGTLNFLPPEFYTSDEIMNWHKADIFAVGMTILGLLSNGRMMYDNFFDDKEGGEKFFQKIRLFVIEKAFTKKVDLFATQFPLVQKYKEMIIGMLQPDPEKRWSLDECFDWLSN